VSVRCRQGRPGVLERPLQRCAGAGLGGTPEGLELRPGVREGRERRRVRRAVTPPGPAPELARHGPVDARFVDACAALESERRHQRGVVLPRVRAPLGVARRRLERLLWRGHPQRRPPRHRVGTLPRLPVVSVARVPHASQEASGW
jgi:hypothetical protein